MYLTHGDTELLSCTLSAHRTLHLTHHPNNTESQEMRDTRKKWPGLPTNRSKTYYAGLEKLPTRFEIKILNRSSSCNSCF
jgi:hypothetical protein